MAEVMKPKEIELIQKISELQSIVSEMKTGLSGALEELRQIQHADTRLWEVLEETRQSCNRRTFPLESLVYSLKEELGEMRCQLSQQQKLQQGSNMVAQLSRAFIPTQKKSCVACQGGGASSKSTRGSFLLHCYLQGLRARQHPDTGKSTTTTVSPRSMEPTSVMATPLGRDVLKACFLEGKRRQVALELLNAEQEYVSSLFQLHDKYKLFSQKKQGSCQKFVRYMDQMLQHHVMFRNALEDRLTRDQRQGLVGDVLTTLTCQDNYAFVDMYLGYLRALPGFLSELDQPDSVVHDMQGCLDEREELLQISLLLAPISRIHNYLAHIQNLLQWTGKEHPDCYLLKVSEKAFRHLQSQCHVLLEGECRQDDKGEEGGSLSVLCPISDSKRKNETSSQGLEIPDEGECDQEVLSVRLSQTNPEDFSDMSGFDYSSVTLGSSDGTLEMRGQVGYQGFSVSGHEGFSKEEEKSEVLLKPSDRYTQPLALGTQRERSVSRRWQAYRVPSSPAQLNSKAPSTAEDNGPRVNNDVKPSPQWSRTRAFSDQIHKQGKSSLEHEYKTPHKNNQDLRAHLASRQPQHRRQWRSSLEEDLISAPCGGPMWKEAGGTGTGGDSEDSEEPCSTV